MSSAAKVHLEDVIQDVGGCGRFQILLGFIVHSVKGVVCFTMVFMVFGAAVPDWWCVDDIVDQNITAIFGRRNISQYQSCTAFNGTKQCSSFLYADAMRTVVTEVNIYSVMRKRVFGHMQTLRARISLASAQSDQGLRCPLTELLEANESNNGDRMPGWDFAHALGESETVRLLMLEETFSLI